MKSNSTQSHNYLSDVLGNSISNVKADWKSISLEEHCIPPGENPEICINQHIIGVHTGQHVNMYMNMDGLTRKFTYLTGDIILVPAEVPVRAHVDRMHISSSFNLTQDLLARNALEMWDVDKFELIPSFPFQDPLIKQMAEAIRVELSTNPDGCKIYATSMANSLAIHLLSRFSKRRLKAAHVAEGLSSKKLKTVLEYISENLENNIKLQDLSGLIGYGQYNFSHAFKKATGLSPYQYIIQERVALAKQLLAQRNMSISEIAIACGFSHQSHLNRHFKRLVGTTPKVFQRS